jgi:hypothetical protein
LHDPPVQYADYAIWEKGCLQGEDFEKQLNYWKRHLDGLQPLQLPTDRPRPPAATFNGATASLTLSPKLSKQLLELGRTQNSTPYMVLLAAFQVL